MAIIERVLDRRAPSNFEHVEKYPAPRRLQQTVSNVEKTLTFPDRYIPIYDQGAEGACVGFGESIMMSILNRKLYDALWLYREAQLVDEWSDTPPEEGTSLSAGFDILRDKGHRRLWGGGSRPPEMDEGIVGVNRWLTTVDEIRTAISLGKPVCFGINWYQAFYNPTMQKSGRGNKSEAWISVQGANWGRIAGGHCIVGCGASDRRQAILLPNSWGLGWGIKGKAWVPYDAVTRLLGELGECAIVTDR
jgi:hypothetical protein